MQSINTRPGVSTQQGSDSGRAPKDSTKILFFAQRECWPPDTGQKLRNYYLARELARRGGLTYLSFEENRASSVDDPASAAFLPESIDSLSERAIYVPRTTGNKPINIIRGAIGRKPLPMLNYKTAEMARQLAELIGQTQFDLVQVESIHLADYYPIIQSARPRPFAICDWHNVESELMRRYSERGPTIAHRLYARITAHRMLDIERQMLRDFDAHTVVSERDRDRLLELAPDAQITVIENGVDCDYYSDAQIALALGACQDAFIRRDNENRDAHGRRRVVFVGSMDYQPNIQAVTQFARDVWPIIRLKCPEMVFTIVGRSPAPQVLALNGVNGIEVTGTVADVRPYYREALASVVPLRMGAGSRLKILESMAAGVPVISTRLGAEGLEVIDGQNIVLAETSDEIASAVISAATADQKWQDLARAARQQVYSRYDWSAIGQKLFDLHLKYLGKTVSARHAAG